MQFWISEFGKETKIVEWQKFFTQICSFLSFHDLQKRGFFFVSLSFLSLFSLFSLFFSLFLSSFSSFFFFVLLSSYLLFFFLFSSSFSLSLVNTGEDLKGLIDSAKDVIFFSLFSFPFCCFSLLFLFLFLFLFFLLSPLSFLLSLLFLSFSSLSPGFHFRV